MQKITKKRWVVAEKIPSYVREELKSYSPFLSQMLFNRGITTTVEAENYFKKIGSISNPFKMKDMDAAVERIITAIKMREKIAVYGDYDVDGVTATAVLVQVIKQLNGDVCEYIPNRFDEGYGLNTEALDLLAESGIDLIITVDCGIRSIKEIDHALSKGLEMIITDHHEPLSVLPQCQAIISPKRDGDTYPEKNLAGVGIAYKLVEAILAKMDNHGLRAEDWLDLVAIGTVADLVPLTGENRALVKAGLREVRFGRRPGVRSLAGVTGRDVQQIKSSDIGFMLGPRLNAAGRLDSALQAYELLSTQEMSKSGLLAQKLDDQNRSRQQITTEMMVEAEIQIEQCGDNLLLFAVHKDFNEGVVGLVASRLTEKYYRPSIICHKGEEVSRASCRSIKAFHITHALDRVSHLLVRHGGHSMAAGFTVENEYLDELIENLRQIASEEIRQEDLIPTINADIEVELQDLHPNILKEIDLLEPTGIANPSVLFVSRNLDVKYYKRVGADKTHLRLSVSDGTFTFNCIAFRHGDWADHMPEKVDLLFSYERNSFQGNTTLQLRVVDIQASS